MKKIKLHDIHVNDIVKFVVPGREEITGKVGLIQETTGFSSRLFYNDRNELMNRYPDGGTDVWLVQKGEPTPEELARREKASKAYQEFENKPVGTIYGVLSSKASGSALIKIEGGYWIWLDYAGYGSLDADKMMEEQAFEELWDDESGTLNFESEMEVCC